MEAGSVARMDCDEVVVVGCENEATTRTKFFGYSDTMYLCLELDTTNIFERLQGASFAKISDIETFIRNKCKVALWRNINITTNISCEGDGKYDFFFKGNKYNFHSSF
jgi:hypothetical protein